MHKQQHGAASGSPTYRPLGRMPLYRSGAAVQVRGREATVEHVLISRGQLFVQVRGSSQAIPAEQVLVEPTELHWPAHRKSLPHQVS